MAARSRPKKFRQPLLAIGTVTCLPAETDGQAVTLGQLNTALGGVVGTPGPPGPAGPAGTNGTNGTNGAPGPSAQQFIHVFSGAASTYFDATTKRVVGEFYFDPTDTALGTSGASTAFFEVLLQTSAGANAANCDLYRSTGSGAPVIAGSVNTASTVAQLLSVDVSSAFIPTGAPGNYSVRIWATTNTGNDYASCTMARIRLVP